MTPPATEWDIFRLAARELVDLGGAAALARLGIHVVERKDDRSPVTEVDRVVQSLILDEIAARFPDHAVLVEERMTRSDRHADRRSAPFCWVVDPIDGTRNFSRGSRMFATAVALLSRGEPVAAAIFDANRGEVYSAARGGGAFLNDEPLHIRDRPLDPDTTLALSSFRHHPIPKGVRRLFDEILFRNVGSACLQLAWTAAGFIDAFIAFDCKLWDVAAGAMLIAEAGGVVTDPDGRPRWPVDLAAPPETTVPVVAGAPTIHALLLQRIRG